MIPDEKSAAVFRGLREAFDAGGIDDIRRMSGGLGSDLVFRIVVQGRHYVLRLMTRMDERKDPARIFACMKTAAEGGVAPRVWYANAEDGVTIFDYVEPLPFAPGQAVVEVARALRRLHALPRFPRVFNYVTAHNGFIWRFRNAGLFPQIEVEEVFTRYEQVCAAYPRLESDMVSCHMAGKPENILFDGRRVWLVDWDAAFVNDRYFDLAVAANFVPGIAADEQIYLEQYFGQPADEYQRARFFLMRTVLQMLTATMFLLLGSAGKPITQTEELSSLSEFHRRSGSSEISLADDDQKLVYGTLHWEELRRNVRQTRFDEALRVVAERNSRFESVRPLLPGV